MIYPFAIIGFLSLYILPWCIVERMTWPRLKYKPYVFPGEPLFVGSGYQCYGYTSGFG